MVNLKALRDRLPKTVADVAYDSLWTLAFEASAIVTIMGSFLMLGRELGPAGYGEYVGLFALLTPVAAIGSAASLATMQGCFQEGRPVDEVVSTFLTVTVLGGSVAAVIASGIAPQILDTLSMTAIVAFAVGELVLAPSVRVISAGIRARLGVPASVRVQMMMLFGRFAALLGLFIFDFLTVERLGIGWLIATGVVLVGLLTVSLPRLGVRVRPKKVAMKDIRTVGALGAPIYIGEFQTNGDKVVLAGANLDREAGLYGAAFRIARLALTPLRAMDIAVFHRFLVSDEGEIGLHVKRARRYAVWSLGVVIPIALVLLVLAPALKLIVGDEFDDAVQMTRWLVLWFPFKAISGPPLSGLLGLGRLGLRLVTLIASASISMTLYLMLIPDMGWEGAVIGTVVGEICLAAFVWIALLWAQRQRDLELRTEPALVTQ